MVEKLLTRNQALEESERSGIPSTKRLASGAEKPTLYLAAKKGCYDDVFLTYGVLPKKSSGEALISRLRKPLKNGPEDLATRNTIANEIPRADPRQGTGGQNRGQGLNVNPTTLKEPSDRLDRHWVGSGRSGRGKPGRKQKYSQERSDEPEERRTPYYPLHVVW